MKRKIGIEIEYNIPPTEGFGKVLKKAAKATGFPFISEFRQIKSAKRKGKVSEAGCWVLKDDGSCSTEVNTPATTSLARLSKGLSILQREIPEIWCQPNGQNCGLHIHVDIHDCWKNPYSKTRQHRGLWNLKKLSPLLFAWVHQEHYFFAIQPPFRRTCDFCCPIYDRLEEAIGEEESEDIDFLVEDYLDHEASLCLNPDYKTIEFRMGAATLSARDILNWAELCRSWVTQVLRRKWAYGVSFEGWLNLAGVSQKIKDWVGEKRGLYDAHDLWGS